MDIFIALLISIGVLYFLYGNPTKRKFEKAIDALKRNEFDLAMKHLTEIIDKHPQAKNKIDEIVFKRAEMFDASGQVVQAYSYFSQVKHDNKLITLANDKLIRIDLHRGKSAFEK